MIMIILLRHLQNGNLEYGRHSFNWVLFIMEKKSEDDSIFLESCPNKIETIRATF